MDESSRAGTVLLGLQRRAGTTKSERGGPSCAVVRTRLGNPDSVVRGARSRALPRERSYGADVERERAQRLRREEGGAAARGPDPWAVRARPGSAAPRGRERRSGQRGLAAQPADARTGSDTRKDSPASRLDLRRADRRRSHRAPPEQACSRVGRREHQIPRPRSMKRPTLVTAPQRRRRRRPPPARATRHAKARREARSRAC